MHPVFVQLVFCSWVTPRWAGYLKTDLHTGVIAIFQVNLGSLDTSLLSFAACSKRETFTQLAEFTHWSTFIYGKYEKCPSYKKS